MPLAIQVWLYKCCSNVPPKTASKVVFKNIEPMKKELAKLQIPQKDAIQHESSIDSDDDFQVPLPRKINEHSKKKQKVDSSTPVAKKPLRKKQINIFYEHTQTRTPAPRDAKADGLKTTVFKPIPTRQASSSKMKKEKQTTREQVVDIEADKLNVDEGGLEQSGQYFSPDVVQSSDNISDSTKHIDVCLYYLRKKSKYGPHSSYKNEPNKSYKYSTVDCNFMNVIRSLMDVYSMDHQNLNAGGQEHHLIEYINRFRMHAAVPRHLVEYIFIPVNIKEKHHWVLSVLSFSERCIFLYDSYESSGHYAAILAEIEKIAKIIPLCLQACDFYVKKEIDLQNDLRYKDKESSDMFDVLFEDDLPQKPSGSLDCGVFMVTYAECLSYGHKVIATEFDPNALHTRYAALLWDYGIRKQEANAISDVESPLRLARQSRITSVTEVFDV
ncbi:hypothetical protein FXO38_36422 [Capsicum annuum]|nr:hypothetical protein FXO38_36422 [Capsicum annuum]